MLNDPAGSNVTRVTFEPAGILVKVIYYLKCKAGWKFYQPASLALITGINRRVGGTTCGTGGCREITLQVS